MSVIRRSLRPAAVAIGATGLVVAGPVAWAKPLPRPAHPALHASDSNAVVDTSSQVMDASGQPATQPKAQILLATGTDDGTTLTFRVKTAQFADPASDPGWQSPLTGFDWEVDTTVPGADQYDAVLASQQTSSSSPVAAVLYANSGTGSDATSTVACTGTYATDASSSTYAVTFPATCIDSASFFRFAAESAYDTTASDTTGADADFDVVPDGLLAPVPEGLPDVEAGGTGLPSQGYWLFAKDGEVFNHGEAQFYGSAAEGHLNAPIISAVATADGKGYYLVGADGGVFTYGDATFHGSEGAAHLNAPIVSIIPDSTGGGYWLIAKDGGVFAFGDATYQGSEGGTTLNAPVVGGAASGSGYYLVAADGGIFTFGGAPFDGSTGSMHLNQPVVGMAVASQGGYYLVASDGGVFTFGGAPFDGSTGGMHLNDPVVSLVPATGGSGYRLVASDGGIFSFGGAEFDGSEGGSGLGAAFVAAQSAPSEQ